MKTPPRFLWRVATILLASSALAQSFAYNDFSSVSTLTMLGNAAQSGAVLQLTSNASDQTSWAWHGTAVPVVAGFDTTIAFRITPPTVGTKGHGMALVLHDDPRGLATTGGTVSGLGYGSGANGVVGIRNSIAIELDTFWSVFVDDSSNSNNQLSIHTRGNQPNHEDELYSIARVTPATQLSNGALHTLRVRYVPGMIELYVDGSATAVLARAYDFIIGGRYRNDTPAPAQNFAAGTAFVGLCATTGANTETELVEIVSWTWTSSPLPDSCYVGTVGEDLLRVNGQLGGLLRTVRLPTHQPFSIDVASPTAHGPGAPWVLLGSLFPSPGHPAAVLPFGSMCMEVAPFGFGTVVLADAFAQTGSLPSSPTPYTIQLPTGAIPFVLDITLQAVVVTSSSPLQLGVTNAIDLDFRDPPAPTISTVSPLSPLQGQTVTIMGTGFLDGLRLSVNGVPAPLLTRTATLATFACPAGLPCSSQLQVQNLDGHSATSVFNPGIAISSINPPAGTSRGGLVTTIRGTNFVPGMTVRFGANHALVFTGDATSVSFRTPAGSPGVVPVVVTSPGGCTASTTYMYL
jgi:hypothetical protein